MDKTLEQLARYVYQQLQQGVSEQNIRAALVQNKWTPDWIDAVFNVVHQNPNMFRAPSIQPLKRSQPIRPVASDSVVPADTLQGAEQESETDVPKQNKSGKKWLLGGIAVILVAVGVGAYMALARPPEPAGNQQQKAPAAVTTEEPAAPPKLPDEERKDDLNTLLSDLADFYVARQAYPTFEQLNSKDFTDQSHDLHTAAFADPKWSADNTACTKDGRAILAPKPTPFCYAYAATTSSGTACDNAQLSCTRITAVVMLEDGSPYPITLDRNAQVGN